MSMQITLFGGENMLLSTCDIWLPFVSVPLFYILPKFLTHWKNVFGSCLCMCEYLTQIWNKQKNVFTEIFVKI